MKLQKLIRVVHQYLSDSDYRFLTHVNLGLHNKLDDETFLKRKFHAIQKIKLNLEHPQSFSEKLQWLKLYDRNPEYTKLVDKAAVRAYVAGTIGEEYLIPMLGEWEDPEEIDFDELPEQFVLKCNHNSGLGMCICRDKHTMNRAQVISKLKKGLAENYYLKNREWPYKNVPRKILCESFLSDGTKSLADYKIHCFHGQPRFILVCRDRFSEKGMTEDFFTPQWEHMELKRPAHANSLEPIPRPEALDKLLELAKKLAGDMPFARIDFYVVKERIYFGEITLYPASGFIPFEPREWDMTFGSWLTLPER